MQRWVGRTGVVAGVVVTAAALLAFGAAVGGSPAPDPAQAVPRAAGTSGRAATTVEALQAELSRLPGNVDGWSALGLAYVTQARLTGDPTFYTKAQGALDKSLQLRPDDNAQALTGQAVLASARHEFSAALELADRSLALNSYNSTTYGVRADALTELGRYDEAQASVQRMLDLRPGTDALTRGSYQLELRGETDRARDALQRAREAAGGPGDKAYASFYLGELAWNGQDPTGARALYDQALEDDKTYLPALAGRARTKAAAGDIAGALADYRDVTTRLPLPQYVVEYGELLEATGDTAAAQEQYDLVRAEQQLFVSQGSVVDLELALFEADRGDPAAALAAGRAAYDARPNAILVQDAYAWALQSAGRSAEALPLARASVRLGTPLPGLYYHLGVIEAAAGNRTEARAALQKALALNPAWSPLYAPRAVQLLATLT